jgi:phosphoserine aminotransferase
MPSTDISLPADLRPSDGRFGAGPSKVRQDAVDRLAKAAPDLLGTSHRQAPVKNQVRRVRDGLRQLFDLPEGYEVALGNGGATLFWEAAAFSLIAERSAHAVFGEFSSKFAQVAAGAPHLAEPALFASDFGAHPEMEPVDGVDLYALTHNETSTGVAMPVKRPAADGLVAVDGTSAAGSLPVDLAECDAYYFAPQKGFASEGGLWLALLSPAALERIEEVTASGRWIPPMLDLKTAVDNSRKDQTYNTPSISTLFLMAEQIDWMNAQGGLAWAVEDCARKAAHLYEWAARSDHASPYVADPWQRSNVICTIDLDDAVAAADVSAVLRANGVLDTDAYRKLGRNQLRIAVFPAVDFDDVERLTAAIDFIVERLRG